MADANTIDTAVKLGVAWNLPRKTVLAIDKALCKLVEAGFSKADARNFVLELMAGFTVYK